MNTEKNSTTHTPGPWKVNLERGPNGASIYGPDDFLVVALPRRADRSYVQKESDAHLIAAAPDLLEAARACEAVIGFACRCHETHGGGDCAGCQAGRQLQDAIAKAEGKG